MSSSSKKHFVATTVEEYIVPFERLRHYFGLCIIEADSSTQNLRLPPSLRPEESIYFDRILFIVMGTFPKALLDDFSSHFTNKQSDYLEMQNPNSIQLINEGNVSYLPPNVCFISQENQKRDYINMVVGSFLTRTQTRVTLFGQRQVTKIYTSFSKWNYSTVSANQTYNTRLQCWDTDRLQNYQEQNLVLFGDNQIFIPQSNKEKEETQFLIRKVLSQIKKTSQSNKTDFNIAQIQVIISELIKDSCVNNERSTLLILFQLIASKIFKNDIVFEQFMLGKINNLETLTSKLNNVEFDQSLLNRLNLSNVEEEEKNEELIHQGPGKQSQEKDHQIVNKQDQTQQSIEQSEINKIQHSLQHSTETNKSKLSDQDLFETYFREHSIAVVNTFVQALKNRSRIAETNKAKKLVPSFSNFSRNLVISRERDHLAMNSNEKMFLKKFNENELYHQLVGITVLAFLVDQGCVNFIHNQKDRDIEFNKEQILIIPHMIIDNIFFSRKHMSLNLSICSIFNINQEQTIVHLIQVNKGHQQQSSFENLKNQIQMSKANTSSTLASSADLNSQLSCKRVIQHHSSTAAAGGTDKTAKKESMGAKQQTKKAQRGI